MWRLCWEGGGEVDALDEERVLTGSGLDLVYFVDLDILESESLVIPP